MTEADFRAPTEAELLHQAIETFRVFSGAVLVAFATNGQGLRDTVTRKPAGAIPQSRQSQVGIPSHRRAVAQCRLIPRSSSNVSQTLRVPDAA
jgi:hypothetical protein